MAMKIIVDRELCQGHSVCVAECPEVFRVVETQDGYPQVVLLQDTPSSTLTDKVNAAAQYCPNHVITVVEE